MGWFQVFVLTLAVWNVASAAKAAAAQRTARTETLSPDDSWPDPDDYPGPGTESRTAPKGRIIRRKNRRKTVKFLRGMGGRSGRRGAARRGKPKNKGRGSVRYVRDKNSDSGENANTPAPPKNTPTAAPPTAPVISGPVISGAFQHHGSTTIPADGDQPPITIIYVQQPPPPSTSHRGPPVNHADFTALFKTAQGPLYSPPAGNINQRVRYSGGTMSLSGMQRVGPDTYISQPEYAILETDSRGNRYVRPLSGSLGQRRYSSGQIQTLVYSAPQPQRQTYSYPYQQRQRFYRPQPSVQRYNSYRRPASYNYRRPATSSSYWRAPPAPPQQLYHSSSRSALPQFSGYTYHQGSIPSHYQGHAFPWGSGYYAKKAKKKRR